MPLLHPSRGSLSTRISILVGVLTALAITAFLLTLMLVLYRKGKQLPVPAATMPRAESLDRQSALPPAYTYLQLSSTLAHAKAHRAASQGSTKASRHAGPSESVAPSRPSISSYTSRSRLWSPPGSIVAHGPSWKQAPLPPRTQESLSTLPSTWSCSTLAAPAPGAQKLSQGQGSLIRSHRSSFVATSESGSITLLSPQVKAALCPLQPMHIELQQANQAHSTDIPFVAAVATSPTGHSCSDPTCSLHLTRPRSTSLPARIDAPCPLRRTPLPSSTSTLTTVGESTIVEQQEWRITTTTTSKAKEAETEAEGEGEASVDSFVAVMLKRCSSRMQASQSLGKHAESEVQEYKDGIVDANERLAAVFEALGLGKADLTGSRHLDAVQASA